MRLFCHPSFAEPKVLIPFRLRLVVALRRVNGPETSLDVSSRQYAKHAGKGIRPVLDLHPRARRDESRSSSPDSVDFVVESKGDLALEKIDHHSVDLEEVRRGLVPRRHDPAPPL